MSKKIMKKIVSIEKQELSAEKIELALVDDAKKIINGNKNVFQIYSDIESVTKEVVKEYANLKIRIEKIKDTAKAVIGMESLIDKSFTNIKKADDVLRQMNQQAKELGISPTKIKEYDELFDFTVKASKGINEARKFIRDVKEIRNELK
jgi:hypothetical protein